MSVVIERGGMYAIATARLTQPTYSTSTWSVMCPWHFQMLCLTLCAGAVAKKIPTDLWESTCASASTVQEPDNSWLKFLAGVRNSSKCLTAGRQQLFEAAHLYSAQQTMLDQAEIQPDSKMSPAAQKMEWESVSMLYNSNSVCPASSLITVWCTPSERSCSK